MACSKCSFLALHSASPVMVDIFLSIPRAATVGGEFGSATKPIFSAGRCLRRADLQLPEPALGAYADFEAGREARGANRRLSPIA